MHAVLSCLGVSNSSFPVVECVRAVQLADVMLQSSSENVQLTAKYDMWQLGVMVRDPVLYSLQLTVACSLILRHRSLCYSTFSPVLIYLAYDTPSQGCHNNQTISALAPFASTVLCSLCHVHCSICPYPTECLLQVYEVMTKQQYWLADMKDSEVLSVMANPARILPHQQRPILEPRVQAVIEKLLKRDPEDRIDAASLKKSLVVDLGTLAEMTINNGPQGTSTMVEEPHCVLEGN